MNTILKLLVLLSISNAASTATVKMQCNYNDVNWVFDNIKQKGYKCTVYGKFEVKERKTDVAEILRDDPERYPQPQDYGSPSELYINQKYIKHFPKRLEYFFGHLRILQIINSELTEIRQEDLKVFTGLASLNLNRNSIEVLEKDLFKFNSKLQGISINSNCIKFIDENIIDHLNDLFIFILLGNNCINIAAYTKAELGTNIKSNIVNNCQTFGELEEVVKVNKTGTQHGRYFWVLVGCGIIVGVFVVCAVVRIIYGIIKKV